LKLPSSAFSLIFSMLSTVTTLLYDLSATFDTVDHEILLKTLRLTFGVDKSVLSWFQSYLAGRRQHVRCVGKRSAFTDVVYGVSQGSVLGNRDRSLYQVFIIYTADLASIVAS